MMGVCVAGVLRHRWSGMSDNDFRAVGSLVTEMTNDDLAVIESNVSSSTL